MVAPLSKSSVAYLRQELDAALKLVAAKTGIDFSIGIIRFDATSARCKIEGFQRNTTVTTPTGTTVTAPANAEANQLQRYVAAYRITADLTRNFYFAGVGNAKVIGYVPRRPKYPFIIQTVAGKRYKVSANSFKAATAVTA